jgi:eukaryotic-like serine/threonine-protein kinase
MEIESIGKYEVAEEIGRGSMGIVYRGRDPFRDRPVALKVGDTITFSNPHNGERYRNLFFNEMRTVGMLSHPHIIEVYDAGYEDGHYFIAMEFVAGGRTLANFCERKNLLPIPDVADIVFKCAEALDYAHRKGVIHRDIKPSNVMLGRDRAVKVCDFGVALLTPPHMVDTQLMELVGSPMYMSPEQLREEPLTHQSDLFSLGLVLYELLSGQHPFPAETLPGLTHRVLNDAPIPVRHHRLDVPESLERILDRALAKDLTSRYPSALDFAADLSQSFSALQSPMDGITTERRVDALKKLSFFEGFDDAEIWELLRWAAWEEYADGQTIIVEGEEDASFFILVEGTVSVRKGERPVTTLYSGECFGEIGYLARRHRSATVVAAGQVSVLRMTAEHIDRASIGCRVQFQTVFIRTLIERLVQTTDALAGRGPCDV